MKSLITSNDFPNLFGLIQSNDKSNREIGITLFNRLSTQIKREYNQWIANNLWFKWREDKYWSNNPHWNIHLIIPSIIGYYVSLDVSLYPNENLTKIITHVSYNHEDLDGYCINGQGTIRCYAGESGFHYYTMPKAKRNYTKKSPYYKKISHLTNKLSCCKKFKDKIAVIGKIINHITFKT